MRGGRRAGAGRPAMNEKDKRVIMAMTVSQEARDWIRHQASEQGVSSGRIVEELIKSFEDSCQ